MINKTLFFIFVLLFSSCGSSVNQLKMSKNFVQIIKSQTFQEWKGIPEDYNIENTKKDFNTIHQADSNTGIPAQEAQLVYAEEENYGDNLEFYFLDNKLVKIIIENPSVKDVEKWLESLGESKLKYDYFVNVLKVEQGEWVYPEKGISIRLTPEKNKILGLSLFSPCTEEDFQRLINVIRDEPIEWEMD